VKYRGVTKRGNSIRITYTYGGKQHRETVALSPTPANMRFAANKLAAIKYAIACGKSPRAPDSVRTVGTALSEWLVEVQHSGHSYSTWSEYRLVVQNVLLPEFGGMLLSEFERAGDKVLAWRNALGCGASRANGVLIPLRGMAEREYLGGRMTVNPMERVTNLPVRSRTADPFEPHEVEAILEHAGADRNLLQFAFHTGLRPSELLALTWDKVDWKQRTVQIDTTIVRGRIERRTKTDGSTRSLHLLTPAYKALSAQRSRTPMHLRRCFTHGDN